MNIGRWRYFTAAIFIFYFTIVVVLPFLVLVWSSLQRFYSVPSLAALKNLSFDSYRTVLAYPQIGTAIWNSLLLSLGSATLIMLATSVLCWIVVRTQASRTLADRQPRLAAAGVSRPGARPRDHDLLSDPADRGLRHHLDHADRLCDAFPALRHALQCGLDPAASQGA